MFRHNIQRPHYLRTESLRPHKKDQDWLQATGFVVTDSGDRKMQTQLTVSYQIKTSTQLTQSSEQLVFLPIHITDERRFTHVANVYSLLAAEFAKSLFL